ncbi:ASKHA domain-containing protein [Metallumcola ferriviriculae]|uniref:ASKHA domain-containing protein n=1 Tax=Metallumcola ferriviriculae TaxID=3039180 RepID=A0AAU0UNK2_9FIRM|nr:ASKHA domain-containing protein [Desulfitibacteraceae bacterium MK1]
MSKHLVKFLPDDISLTVETGTNVLRAASIAGIEIKSVCGGKGSCGRCAIKVQQGQVRLEGGNRSKKMKEQGLNLACQTFIEGDVVIEVPKDSRLEEHQVVLENENHKVLAESELDLLSGYEFKPLCRKVQLTLEPPTLTENASDLTRLQAELRQKTACKELMVELPVLQQLAEALRQEDWKVTATLACMNGITEIVQVEPGHVQNDGYGLAVDIGTTTVVVYVVDLATGDLVDSRGTYNKQARYGDDVISRMIHAGEKNGLDDLRKAVIGSINELIDKLLEKNNISPDDVHVAVTAGNTTMAHLLLGLPPKYIRLEPYIPTATELPPVKARLLGININPEAWVLSFPAVASYVGGDIVAGVLAAKMAKVEMMTLFIDIGTNGEIVLGNNEFLISCACSAGPAFEGGGITFGMRAMGGAIERVSIDPETFDVSLMIIGNEKPIGICGSGLIDCMAKLHRVGLIDRTGQFFRDKDTPRLRKSEDGWEYVLAWAEESGVDKDVVITEADIKNLLRSKGAVFAGIQSLLKSMQLDVNMIEKIIIAGGFGNYLNVDDAVQIGLLPDVDRDRYEFMGNTSVKGAKLALLSQDAYKECKELGHLMTYLELSAGTTFMDEFVSATFIPHTDLTLFPSLNKDEQGKEVK